VRKHTLPKNRIFHGEGEFINFITDNGEFKKIRGWKKGEIRADVIRVKDGKIFEVKYPIRLFFEYPLSFTVNYSSILHGLVQAVLLKEKYGDCGLILPFEIEKCSFHDGLSTICRHANIELLLK